MEDDSLEIVESGRYGTNERLCEAWALNGVKQRIERSTGRPVQILTAWDCNPIELSDDGGAADIGIKEIDAIAARVTDAALVWFEEQKRKHTLLLWVGIIAVIMTLAVVIPVAFGIMHGQVHIPVPTPKLD